MRHNVKMLVFGALFLAVIIALQFYGIGGKYLVWVAILACLGMHFFMGHGGNGHEGHADMTPNTANAKKSEKPAGHKSHGGGGCCH